MIISISKLLSMQEFSGVSELLLERKLKAIEDLIRAYTNNNFQNTLIRFNAPSSGTNIAGTHTNLKIDDTVQISQSINSGLYAVLGLGDNITILDKPLLQASNNLITKVEYPPTIVDGVINLLFWDIKNREKVGIKSESISRHSVTYFEQDANNQIMGYPISLLGFLKPFMKARF